MSINFNTPSTPPLLSTRHADTVTGHPTSPAQTIGTEDSASIVTPHGLSRQESSSYFHQPFESDSDYTHDQSGRYPIANRGVLDASKILNEAMRQHREPVPMPRVLRKGEGLEGPKVDEAIKGVPQGWEDDPSIPLPETPTAVPPPPRQQPASGSPSKPLPSPAEHALSPPRHHTRLNSFRGLSGTRMKLATWRDRAFPELAGSNAGGGGSGSGWSIGIGNVQHKDEERRKLVHGLMGGSAQRLRVDKMNSRRRSSLGAEGALRPSNLPTTEVLHSRDTPSIDLTDSHRTAESLAGETVASNTESFAPSSYIHPKDRKVGSTSSLPLSRTLSVDTYENEATPKSARYQPSITSNESSSSNRERVLGLRTDPVGVNTSSKVFITPKMHDVLPFAAGRPFSAWDLPQDTSKSPSMPSTSPLVSTFKEASRFDRRSSLSLRQVSTRGSNQSAPATAAKLDGVSEEATEGWTDLPKPLNATGQKRIWASKGEEPHLIYKVGWERDVLDMEARLHETFFELAGDKHSFATYTEENEPRTVLDIGTGTGLWPISQSLTWKKARFVGLDIVPVQVDLQALAAAEMTARSTSTAIAQGEGIWEGIARRVTWDQSNFLDELPYDSGVFDHVHLRFLGLAIPEPRWADVLEEAIRVLSPGGTLEIVELGISLSPACPASVKRSFASLLLADMIHPNPSLPIKFALPTIEGLVQSTVSKPVLQGSWLWPVRPQSTDGDAAPLAEIPGCLGDAVMTWVRSAQEYKGTGLVKRRDPSASFGLGGGSSRPKSHAEVGDAVIRKVCAQLGWVGRRSGRWDFGGKSKENETTEADGVTADSGHSQEPSLSTDGHADDENEDVDDGVGVSVVPKAGHFAMSTAGVEHEGVKVWAWVGRKRG